MKIVPLRDKVVIKRLDSNERTVGGIYLPDAAREQPQQGRVLCVGEGRFLANGHRVPMQVREGDRVVFSPYAGIPVKVDDDELLMLSEAEILAVIEGGR